MKVQAQEQFAGLLGKAREAQRPARAGAWAEAATLFFVLVDERGFLPGDAVRWLVREGAVQAGKADQFYTAMRGRMHRKRNAEKLKR